MPDACDLNQTLTSIEQGIKEEQDRKAQETLDDIAPLQLNEVDLIDYFESYLIKEGYTPGKVVEMDDLRKIAKGYGNVKERDLLAIFIKMIIKNNEIAGLIVRDMLKSKKFISEELGGQRQFKNLRDFPQSTLNNILYTLIGFNQSNDTHGVFDKSGAIVNFGRSFKISLFTPKRLGLLESTGGLYYFQEAMTTYYERIQHRINRFMKGYKDKDGKFHAGMAPIIEKVLELGGPSYFIERNKDIGFRGHVDTQTRMFELFTMLMNGQAYGVDKNGNRTEDTNSIVGFEIYTEWEVQMEPAKDEGGNIIRYKRQDGAEGDVMMVPARWPDGEKKFHWTKAQPLATAFDGHFNIEFAESSKKSIIKKLYKAREEAKAINDEVLDYIQQEFDKSIDNILSSYYRIFPQISKDMIENLMYAKEDSDDFILAYNALNSNQKKIYKVLSTTVRNLSSMQFFQYGTQDDSKRKDYWPQVFDKNRFRFMYDNYIQDIQEKYDEVSNLLSRYYNPNLEKQNRIIRNIDKLTYSWKGKVYKGSKAIDMMKKVKKYWDTSLRRATEIRDKHDDYATTKESNEPMVDVADQKYLKRITNAFNPVLAKKTPGVYNEYLRTAMAAIEKNILASRFMDSIKMMQAKDGSFNEDAVEYMRNYYTVPFNNPKTYGSLGPWKYSPEDSWTSKVLGKMFSWTPEQIQDKVRHYGSYLTFRWLSSWTSPVTNMAGIQMHMRLGGMRATTNAVMQWLSPSQYQEKWADLISRSGVIDFNDFFSESMVNDIIGEEIEQKSAIEVLDAMLEFYAREKKNGIDETYDYEHQGETIEATAQAIMEMKIEKVLQDSRAMQMYVKVYSDGPMLSEGRAKARRKKLKTDRLHSIMGKLTNAAINKQFEVSRHLNNNLTGQILRGGQTAWNAWMKFWSVGGVLTMGKTEELLRSTAFIMGVEHARDQGHLPLKPIDEYTEEEEARAIEFGKTFSKLFNYGLSTTDVGQFNWGAYGNMMGKFKYWGQQNMGTEQRIMNEAMLSVASFEEVLQLKDMKTSKSKKVSLKLKHAAKLTKAAFMGNPLTLRERNPEAAAWRNFIVTALPLTLMWNFLAIGPFAGALAGFRQYSQSGRAVRGWTSDLLSMWMGLIQIPMFFWAGWFDDEENQEELAQYQMRNSWFGYLPNITIDFFMGLLYSQHDEDWLYKRFKQQVSTHIPIMGVREIALETLDWIRD